MKNNTKQTLKIYWQHILKYKLSGILLLICIIGYSIIGAIVPLYLKDFFNALAINDAKNIVIKSLISILIIIACLKFLNWLLYRVSDFLNTHFESSIIADLANYCFAYLHKHSFVFFENNFVGSLVKRVNYFFKAFEKIVDQIVYLFIPLTIQIIIIIFVLFKENILLGLGVIVWLIIFLIINLLFIKFKFKYDIERNKAETEATGLLADTITNYGNVKFFTGYPREVKRFTEATRKVQKIRKFTWNLHNIFDTIQSFLMVILEIGILYLAIYLWQKNILTIGSFVLIQTYLIMLFMQLWNFGNAVRSIFEALSDAEEMTEILNTPHKIKDIENAKELKISTGKIEFKKVSFNYHKTKAVLKDFSLIINPQEKIALIGPSGAGKTTVIKLLLRMYDITKGKILIDNQDISQITQESLWKNISLVPQDPILFHRTLMENIRYGKSDASDEEVIEAAKLAHCNEFISKAVDGYNTYVGERGIKLSGGERQRVAIARAILRNAPILIFDEATSSLDSESEYLIQDALDKLMKNKVVITVAHRLSTIKKMDRIIVIDDGKITEEDTHSELIKKEKGIYKKLWELQAGGFIQ
ncbi:MAG: ABC transporter ATP-binding protein [bacterium]|nr:ABC transporter ATP-binding protein [bacterium]